MSQANEGPAAEKNTKPRYQEWVRTVRRGQTCLCYASWIQLENLLSDPVVVAAKAGPKKSIS